MRVLLVEDDSRIAHFVAKGLREQSYAVDVVRSGEEALYQAAINTYDLIILDVMIPAPDGFAVCKELRNTGLRMPILMLTARDAVEDRIEGLDRGADDYLTKPFEFRELLARLRALLRRPGGLQPAQLVVADLIVDTAGQTVSRAGKTIPMTAVRLKGYPSLVMPSTTGAGLNSFMTPSISRNSTTKAFMMRPVQSIFFETGAV